MRPMGNSESGSSRDDDSDSDVDFKFPEETKGRTSTSKRAIHRGIADEASAQPTKLSYQISVDEEMTQIGALLYALLNITGIWNSEARMPRQYRRLRENRDKFFRREIKATIQTLQIE